MSKIETIYLFKTFIWTMEENKLTCSLCSPRMKVTFLNYPLFQNSPPPAY